MSRVLPDQLARGSGRGGLEAGHDLTAEGKACHSLSLAFPASAALIPVGNGKVEPTELPGTSGTLEYAASFIYLCRNPGSAGGSRAGELLAGGPGAQPPSFGSVSQEKQDPSQDTS